MVTPGAGSTLIAGVLSLISLESPMIYLFMVSRYMIEVSDNDT